MNIEATIGPQSASDGAFRRRHRFHQSWYRAFVLGVPPGTGPRPDSTTSYRNMLRREDATTGANFLTSQIAEVALERIAAGGTVEEFRCRHNLLSSQPMCFNLFGPLKFAGAVAAQLVEAVTGRAVEAGTTEVCIEDSPGHLGDHTGLDASIRYGTMDGHQGVLGIETKLTDSFSPKAYPLDHRPGYLKVSRDTVAPFDPDRLSELTDGRWNQLWRNQMLTESIRIREELDHAELLVVHADGDDDARATVGHYGELLLRDDAVAAATLSEVVDVLRRAGGDRRWLDAFTLRYIHLEASEALFAAWRSSGQEQQLAGGPTRA